MDNQEQIDQTLAIVRALDGQGTMLQVSGLGRGAWSCTGTLHVGDGRIDVYRDKDGWRHSLGVDVAALRSLKFNTGEHGPMIEAQVGVML